MLVLSRQRDETIMIGDDVEITIVDIRGDKVRLGITAPRNIQVHRKEVYEAIRRENERASTLSPDDVSDVIDKDEQPREPTKPVDPKKNSNKSNNGNNVDEARPSV